MRKQCVLCGTVADHAAVTLRDMTDVVCPGCGCRERLVATPMRMEQLEPAGAEHDGLEGDRQNAAQADAA